MAPLAVGQEPGEGLPTIPPCRHFLLSGPLQGAAGEGKLPVSWGPLSCPKLPPCHTSWAHAIQTGTQSPHLRHGGLMWGRRGPHTVGAERKARPGCGCYFLLSGEGRRTQEAISPCWCLMPGAAQAAASSQFDRQASLSGEALFPPGDRELLLAPWAPGRLAPGSGVTLLVPRGGWV